MGGAPLEFLQGLRRMLGKVGSEQVLALPQLNRKVATLRPREL